MNELRILLDLVRGNLPIMHDPHLSDAKRAGRSPDNQPLISFLKQLFEELCEELGGEQRVELNSMYAELAEALYGE